MSLSQSQIEKVPSMERVWGAGRIRGKGGVELICRGQNDLVRLGDEDVPELERVREENDGERLCRLWGRPVDHSDGTTSEIDEHPRRFRSSNVVQQVSFDDRGSDVRDLVSWENDEEWCEIESLHLHQSSESMSEERGWSVPDSVASDIGRSASSQGRQVKDRGERVERCGRAITLTINAVWRR